VTPIGQIVKAAREEAGISRTELGRRITGSQVPGSHLGRIERDECSPTVDKLEQIATALGLALVIELRPPGG
jgi:transcriptional regulator with XRE-family HTH domain